MPTAKRLFLLRHAKSSWDDPGLDEPELYHADADHLLERLRRVSDDVESVMVIGHNPTMQITALRLSDANGSSGDGSHRAQISQKFPTGALATLSFDCRWSELGPDCARLVDYVRPKAIARRAPSASPSE